MSDSVGQYLNEIGAVALLTADDEKMLSKAIEKGRDAQLVLDGEEKVTTAERSTWDGVAMAYEGFFYWDDWDDYIGVKDDRGMIKYMKTGSILFKLEGEDHSSKCLKLFKEIGVEHEIWDLVKLK